LRRRGWERGFFKIAGFMLLSRYQVMNGMTCTKVRSHIEIDNPKQFHEMSMIGYVDSVEEMRLILEERKG
jgi:hypothetical protein